MRNETMKDRREGCSTWSVVFNGLQTIIGGLDDSSLGPQLLRRGWHDKHLGLIERVDREVWDIIGGVQCSFLWHFLTPGSPTSLWKSSAICLSPYTLHLSL